MKIFTIMALLASLVLNAAVDFVQGEDEGAEDSASVYHSMKTLAKWIPVQEDLELSEMQLNELEQLESQREERFNELFKIGTPKEFEGAKPADYGKHQKLEKLYKTELYNSCEWAIAELRAILTLNQYKRLEELVFKTHGIGAVYLKPLQQRLNITDVQSKKLAETLDIPRDRQLDNVARRKFKELARERGLVITEEMYADATTGGGYEFLSPELWKEVYEPLLKDHVETLKKQREKILTKKQLKELNALVTVSEEDKWIRPEPGAWKNSKDASEDGKEGATASRQGRK